MGLAFFEKGGWNPLEMGLILSVKVPAVLTAVAWILLTTQPMSASAALSTGVYPRATLPAASGAPCRCHR